MESPLTTRHAIPPLVVLFAAAVGDGQPLADRTEFRFAGVEEKLVPPLKTDPFALQVMGNIREAWYERDKPAWRILAGWKAHRRPGAAHDPLRAAEVLEADDLQAVVVEFRSRPPHPDRATLALVLDARGAGDGEKLARQSLRFFWQPSFRWKKDIAGENKLTEHENKPTPKVPRFELVSEPLSDPTDRKSATFPAYYQTGNFPHILPREFEYRDGNLEDINLRGLLELMGEIGRTGTGAVYWIAEEGQSQQPENFLLAWLPQTDAWRTPAAVSPKFGRQRLEICQVVPIPTADGRRTGLCRLPKGAWKLIEDNIAAGLRLTAIGSEGLVFETASPDPVYHVYRYRASGFDKEAIRTRGITDGLPPWTAKFDLRFDATPAVARHLVSLVVCSPALWKAPRTDERTPPEHLKSLFADPELWACPPIKR